MADTIKNTTSYFYSISPAQMDIYGPCFRWSIYMYRQLLLMSNILNAG